MTAITIAVCTYRRQHLADTLASISQLEEPPGVSIRVLVIDNDHAPSARDIVNDSNLPFPTTYLHAPAANISLARNAALSTSTTRYIAFVDDDEIVRPGWLKALWLAQQNAGHDVTLGPVNALFDRASSAWIRSGGFHDTRPVYVRNRIVTGYCCNVLIDLAAPGIAGRRFRLDLGRSGGEDTEFFYGATSQGATIGYAPDAMIDEVMPQNRQSLAWLQKRRYRSGQTHALLLREHQGTSASIEIARAGFKALLCGLGCAANLWSPIRWRRWYLRGVLHLGVVAGLLGQTAVAIYGVESTKS